MLIRTAPLRLFARPTAIHRRAMSSFTLDRDIFNASFYKNIQNIWFEGHPLNAKAVDPKILQRWFTAPPKERGKFDDECRANFLLALESIGPDKWPVPTAEPFLREIKDAAQKDPSSDGADAAWTALSIVILLDQITRNIYRSNVGLQRVYGHYDTIALSLARTLVSSKSPIERPDLHPQWRQSIAHRQWFYMPFMHAEDLESHKLLEQIFADIKEEMEKDGGYEGSKMFLDEGIKSAKEHKEIIERFGRFPHRNGPLGRESTPAEKKYLEEGGATFGVAQEDK
jgi:uncharacterized protein (DUF924 family)